MTEKNEKVYKTGKDYAEYFGCDCRTAKKKLAILGFRVPEIGFPMIRKSVLDRKVDATA